MSEDAAMALLAFAFAGGNRIESVIGGGHSSHSFRTWNIALQWTTLRGLSGNVRGSLADKRSAPALLARAGANRIESEISGGVFSPFKFT